MSESARELRPQFGFLSAVGLFFLAVLAVLVGLYFYNADIRQAGDGALDHARAYKSTIASDYSRFYECMRGEAPASAQTTKAESVRSASARSTAPVAVYPPYADYPTYPAYPDAAAGSSAAMAPPGQYGAMGPAPGSPESAPSTMMGGPPAVAMQAGPNNAEPGPAMQAGPAPMQADPSMPGSSGQQAEPAMQSSPPMGPSSMEPGPVMQAGPMMPPGPSMQGMPPNQGMQPGPGMYAGRPMPPGYPTSAAWQGQGMSPSGMPPSGMTAPMPYGQGQSMPPQSSQGGNPEMAGGPMPMYGGPQYQAGQVRNPPGAMPPPPWARYGYGMPGAPGSAGGAPAAPTVVPATPTMPMTSMMPPPAEAAPVLPSDAGQVDPQIAAARQAAANQQHQDAIRIYRGYISRNASDPSAFGELGNVLLSAGRPQEAAQAYYEASSRLIDVGQPGTVYLLLPHIEQHDPLLGAVLMRRLASLPRSIY
jgi:hypothetical protein